MKMSGHSPAGAAVIMGVRISWNAAQIFNDELNVIFRAEFLGEFHQKGVRVSSAQISAIPRLLL
jgi:hypothetical protein